MNRRVFFGNLAASIAAAAAPTILIPRFADHFRWRREKNYGPWYPCGIFVQTSTGDILNCETNGRGLLRIFHLADPFGPVEEMWEDTPQIIRDPYYTINPLDLSQSSFPFEPLPVMLPMPLNYEPPKLHHIGRQRGGWITGSNDPAAQSA